MTDEQGAIWIPVPSANIFPGYWGNTPKWVVIHKTASGGSAQDIANFFIHDPSMASSHYVIGLDGTLVQCVSESDGAGANGVLEAGHAAYLPTDINLNLLTISIEHVDPSPQNATSLTDAQKAVSFKLVHNICVRHNIPMRPGDASGGIIKHADIAPIDRALCPNNYPWSELWAYLKPERNTWVSTSQTQQAQMYWNSTTAGSIPVGGNAPVSTGIFPAGNAPAYSTGIAQSWQHEYMNGRVWGPPISYEFQTVDWSGNPITAQMFAGGRCEWSNGAARWFGWQ